MTRPLPSALEAESAVLGGILLDNAALDRIAGIVRPEDLYKPAHQELLQASLELQAQGQPVDIITLEQHLRAKDKLERAGGVSAIAELSTPTIANIEYHARLVRDKAQFRQLIRACEELRARAYGGEGGCADDLVTEALELVGACFSTELGGRHIREVVELIVDRAKERTELGEEAPGLGLSTGISRLDEMLAQWGLPLGQPTMIGADTSKGKTALAVAMLWAAASRGEPCLVCTYEDDAVSGVNRLFARVARINGHALVNARIPNEQWPAFADAAAQLWRTDVHFFEKPAPPVDVLCSRIRRYVQQHGARLVVIDYLQLIKASSRKRSRQEEVDDTFNQLVDLALSLPDTATLILSQFHRRDEAEKPSLKDFYHSGAIEQGAHTAILIWDPPIKDREELQCKALVVAKQKAGSTGLVIVGWRSEYIAFCDADPYKAKAYESALKTLKGGRRRAA